LFEFNEEVPGVVRAGMFHEIPMLHASARETRDRAQRRRGRERRRRRGKRGGEKEGAVGAGKLTLGTASAGSCSHEGLQREADDLGLISMAGESIPVSSESPSQRQ